MQVVIRGYLENKDLDKTYMYNLNGEKNDNILQYLEDDGTKINLKFFPNKIEFEKENSESKLNLVFDTNNIQKCKYYIKIFNSTIDIECVTSLLKMEDNHFLVKYSLNMGENNITDYEYSLNYLEKEEVKK